MFLRPKYTNLVFFDCKKQMLESCDSYVEYAFYVIDIGCWLFSIVYLLIVGAFDAKWKNFLNTKKNEFGIFDFGL